ncbi:MAG: hypothetical protein WC729_00985 [Sphingomonas sp.]|jgi:hypothetical protein|uniref:hypothetical protein n=1 Tax=Sphingomonas sp. TaxID=28214 RepID=UPI00356A1117
MAITLLSLANGHSSLEFEPSDLPGVDSAIRDRFGMPEQRHYPASTEYRFGGCSFAFQNEWDDPCLISGSVEGDEILRWLCDSLNVGG